LRIYVDVLENDYKYAVIVIESQEYQNFFSQSVNNKLIKVIE